MNVMQKQRPRFRRPMPTQKPNNSIPLVIIICVAVCIAVRSILNVNLPDIITVALSAVGFAVAPLEQGMMILLFILPFKGAVGYHSLLLVFIVVTFIKTIRLNDRISNYIFPCFIILLLEFANVSLAGGSYPEFFRFACYPILLLMYCQWNLMGYFDSHSSVICAKSFCAGAALSALTVLIVTVRGDGWSAVMSGTLRLGRTGDFSQLSDMVVSYNANELGQFCIVAVAVLITLFSLKQIKLPALLLMYIPLMFVGILTLSRTYVICAILIHVIWMFSSCKKPADVVKLVFCLAVIALIAVWLYNYVLQGPIDALIARFSDSDMASGNGRTEITDKYFNLMIEHPVKSLTGFGVVDYRTYIQSHDACHNGLQELLVGCGVIGFVTMICWIWSAVLMSMSMKIKNQFIAFLPLIAILVHVQSGQFISQYHILCIVVLALMCIQIEPGVTDDTDKKSYAPKRRNYLKNDVAAKPLESNPEHPLRQEIN